MIGRENAKKDRAVGRPDKPAGGKPSEVGLERSAGVRAMSSEKIQSVLQSRNVAPRQWWDLWERRLAAAEEREANG